MAEWRSAGEGVPGTSGAANEGSSGGVCEGLAGTLGRCEAGLAGGHDILLRLSGRHYGYAVEILAFQGVGNLVLLDRGVRAREGRVCSLFGSLGCLGGNNSSGRRGGQLRHSAAQRGTGTVLQHGREGHRGGTTRLGPTLARAAEARESEQRLRLMIP